MYNAKGRYALMALFAVTAIILIVYKQNELAALAGFMFAFVLWSHFKHSSILLASKYFKNNDFEKAKKLLAEVPNPDRLAKNRRGYYEFMLANIALKEEDFKAAEQHFQIASRFPLGGTNDKAFVMIHLANIALRNKDKERATAYVERAKELASTSRAQEIIQKIEKETSKI